MYDSHQSVIVITSRMKTLTCTAEESEMSGLNYDFLCSCSHSLLQ